MESYVLSLQVGWEARRIAEALRVEEWETKTTPSLLLCFGSKGVRRFWWHIRREPTSEYRWPLIETIRIGSEERMGMGFYCYSWEFMITSNEALSGEREFLACTLYRLGIQDEDVLHKLNVPLSSHEKLELRLSMPREFWPQKWHDEAD